MPFSDQPLVLETLETRAMLSVTLAPTIINASFVAFTALPPVFADGEALHVPGVRYEVARIRAPAFPNGLAPDEQALHDALATLAAQFSAVGTSATGTTATVQAASVVSTATVDQSALTPAQTTLSNNAVQSAAGTPDAVAASTKTGQSDANLETAVVNQPASTARKTAHPVLDVLDSLEATTAPFTLTESASVQSSPHISLQLLAPTMVSSWPTVAPDIRLFSSLPVVGDEVGASPRDLDSKPVVHDEFARELAVSEVSTSTASISAPTMANHASLASLVGRRGHANQQKVGSGWQIAAVVSAAGAMLLGRWRLAKSRNSRGEATPFSTAKLIAERPDLG